MHETEPWQSNHQALKRTSGHRIRLDYVTTSLRLDNNQEPRATQAKVKRLAWSALETYWSKFIMPALAQRGSRVYVCDPNFDTYDSPEIQAKGPSAFLKLVKEFGAQDRIEVVAEGVRTIAKSIELRLSAHPAVTAP